MKIELPLLIGVGLAALTLCAAPDLSAKGKKSPAPEAAASASPMEKETAAKAPRAIPYRGKIASVDASAKSFTIAGKTTSRVFMVTDKTEIMKDGASATMADIVADEEVRGSYWKKTDGSLEAKKVTIGPKTGMEKAKSLKKKTAATP